jgi:hypothetical protein
MSFPENFGTVLAGLEFEQVFIQHPKWVECVDVCWTENCTGLFLEFYKFIKLRLDDPLSRFAHENRCEKYVKKLKKDKIPEYLVKYASRRTTEIPLGFV